MNHYHLHGGLLASEVSLPELLPAEAGEPDWTIEITRGDPAVPDGEMLGSDQADVDVEVRAYRIPGGYRLRYGDTGVFDVEGDGTRVRWYPTESAPEDLARADLLGRVLAVALHAGGRFALHGSAVAMAAGAIAFVAPKQSGKSTLALALARDGADLMADDMVPVDIGPPALAFPGVHSVRLFGDSVRWLGIPRLEAEVSDDGAKYAVMEPPVRRRMIVAPLRAVYVLEPADAAALAVRREPLDPVAAAMAVVTHAKVGALLGRTETPSLLRRAAALARAVPVHRLQVARDFERLPLVVDTIRDWHDGHLPARALGGGALATW